MTADARALDRGAEAAAPPPTCASVDGWLFSSLPIAIEAGEDAS